MIFCCAKGAAELVAMINFPAHKTWRGELAEASRSHALAISFLNLDPIGHLSAKCTYMSCTGSNS